MKKKLYSIILALALILTIMPASVFADTIPEDICILATSDVHCEIGGYTSLVSLKGERQDTYGEDNVLLVDAGDVFQGGYVGYFDKGQSLLGIVNKVGYDVMVPGNHDFDYTADYYFDTLVKELSADVVSCNISKNGTFKLNPYVIKEVAGRKIAFVGITTPSSLTESNPTNFQDTSGQIVYDFCNDASGDKLYSRIQTAVDAAREEGADYVIAVAHLGDKKKEGYVWDSSDVAANTTGIDAIIDGHAHDSLCDTFTNKDGGSVPVVATADKLTNIDEIIIHSDGTITTKLITTSEISVDRDNAEVIATQDEINAANALVEKDKQREIGQSLVTLTINDENGLRIVRKMETNAGDFVADAYKEVTGADIGVVNGGGVRTNLNSGTITFGQIFDMNPFGNELCVCNVKGQNIIDALEFGSRNAPENEEGGFLQVSGISYKIDPTIECSAVEDENGNFIKFTGKRRVYDVRVDGKAIDPNAYYSVAGSAYILQDGGNGMTMFKGSKVLKEEIMLDNEALIKYVQENLKGTIGTEYQKAQGRISFEKMPVEDPTDEDDKKSDEVKTGDNADVIPYTSLSLLALSGIIAMLLRRRKA